MGNHSTAPARTAPRYRGVFPVVPTIFTESGELDLAGQQRCVDFMIDAGSNGLCILANFSEQFVLADDEREVLTEAILAHVGGRVPVIVTTTHFSTDICLARGRRAQAQGAAMVMVMPPYHGATLRVGTTMSMSATSTRVAPFQRIALRRDGRDSHPGQTSSPTQ